MNDLRNLIFFAAKSRNIAKVEELLNGGFNINETDSTGNSLLRMAFKGTDMCKGVNFELIKMLIERGIDVNLKDVHSCDALYDATLHCTYKNGEKALELVVNSGANLNARYEDDKTLIMELCTRGSIFTMKYLIENGADVNLQDRYGNTALHKALENGWYGNVYSNMAQILIKNGANVHIKNKEGRTAIENAYLKDKKRFVEDLITSLFVSKDFDNIDLCTKEYLEVIYKYEIKKVHGDLGKTDINNLKECINNAKYAIEKKMKELEGADEDSIKKVMEIIDKNIEGISDLFKLEKIKDLALAKDYKRMDNCIKEYFNLIDWKVNGKCILYKKDSLDSVNLSIKRLEELKKYLINIKKTIKDSVDLKNEDTKDIAKKDILLINKYIENVNGMYSQYTVNTLLVPIKNIKIDFTK